MGLRCYDLENFFHGRLGALPLGLGTSLHCVVIESEAVCYCPGRDIR
jgi:hypothetical protein